MPVAVRPKFPLVSCRLWCSGGLSLRDRTAAGKEKDMAMKEPHLLYETEEHIAKIILNRPEAKNAFSPEMIALWREALERSQTDQNIRVIVVTGKGDTF